MLIKISGMLESFVRLFFDSYLTRPQSFNAGMYTQSKGPGKYCSVLPMMLYFPFKQEVLWQHKMATLRIAAKIFVEWTNHGRLIRAKQPWQLRTYISMYICIVPKRRLARVLAAAMVAHPWLPKASITLYKQLSKCSMLSDVIRSSNYVPKYLST